MQAMAKQLSTAKHCGVFQLTREPYEIEREAMAAGLALFRYTTRCGTVFGHTGSTLGYTQFTAATEDGQRSITVSVGAQVTPTINSEHFAELRRVFELGVCAALD